MTSRSAFRHTHGFAHPYHLRQGLLVVLDGVAGSGRTTQLERLREAQHRLFHLPPTIVELPADLQSPEAVARRLEALTALGRGRTVVTERWSYDDAMPDLVLLSTTSYTGGQVGPMPWEAVPADRRVVLPEGHEGIAAMGIWGAMARRRFYGSCLCQVQP